MNENKILTFWEKEAKRISNINSELSLEEKLLKKIDHLLSLDNISLLITEKNIRLNNQNKIMFTLYDSNIFFKYIVEIIDNILFSSSENNKIESFDLLLTSINNLFQTSKKNEASLNSIIGRISIKSPTSETGNCGGIIKGKKIPSMIVQTSASQKGWGPSMYNVVLSYLSHIGKGLISDRDEVSASAQAVWAKMPKRTSVLNSFLDTNNSTPDPWDDCLMYDNAYHHTLFMNKKEIKFLDMFYELHENKTDFLKFKKNHELFLISAYEILKQIFNMNIQLFKNNNFITYSKFEIIINDLIIKFGDKFWQLRYE